MKHILIAVVVLSSFTIPAFGKTHKDVYDMACTKLWPAVKDVLRNSGKYGIIGIDSTEMTASYNIGGTLTGKRINSLVLNTQGDKCELQVQTAYSGLVNNDYGDFKKRVEDALAKQPATPPAAPAPAAAAPATKPEEPAKQ